MTLRRSTWKKAIGTSVTELSKFTVIAAIVLPIAAAAAFIFDRPVMGTAAPEVAEQMKVPLGLPPLPRQPATEEITALGKKLFFDRRLSINGTMSCGMCHVESQAFTATELRTSVGMEGRSLRRRAPSLYNVAYQTSLFRDGRESSLETQVWSPILNVDEMAAPSAGWELDKIRSLPGYSALFAAAYPGRGITMDTVGASIASFERTLLLANSRFDKWRYGGDSTALTDSERLGYQLFVGKAGCSACHLIGEKSALFSDGQYHDTGIGYPETMGGERDHFDVRLAEGNFTRRTEADIQSIDGPPVNDLGRFEVTQDPKDRWAFKTPSLRNVALTAPYMHDGSLATLAEVVEYYNSGGYYSPNKSPLIKPLHLTETEKKALVDFLNSLTGTKKRP